MRRICSVTVILCLIGCLSLTMVHNVKGEAEKESEVSENNVILCEVFNGAEFNIELSDFVEEVEKRKEKQEQEEGVYEENPLSICFPDMKNPASISTTETGETSYSYTTYVMGNLFAVIQIRIDPDSNYITGFDYMFSHSLNEDGTIPRADWLVLTEMSEALGMETFENIINCAWESEDQFYWEEGVLCNIWDFHRELTISINAMSEEMYGMVEENARQGNFDADSEISYTEDELQQGIWEFMTNNTVVPGYSATIADMITMVFYDYDITYEQSEDTPSELEVKISGQYYPNADTMDFLFSGSITYLIDINDGYYKVLEDDNNIIASYLTFIVD